MEKNIHIGVACTAMEMFSHAISDECSIYGHDFDVCILAEGEPLDFWISDCYDLDKDGNRVEPDGEIKFEWGKLNEN